MQKRQIERQRKYHFIYKTTNLINNKYYIGMHSTDNLDDGYIGSGSRLWRSIQYYGKENFKVEILEFLNDRTSLKTREREIVNEEAIKDPMCMNLALGGGYQWPLSQTKKSKLTRIEAIKNYWNSSVGLADKNKRSKRMKIYFSDANNRKRLSTQQKIYRQSRTPEQKEFYSNLMKSVWGKGTILNIEQSQRVKDSWLRDEVRLNRAKGIQNVYDTTDLRERRSKKQTELWKTTDYRDTYITARVGLKYNKVEIKQQELCLKILNSTVDVSKAGWYKKMAEEFGVSYSSIKNIIHTRLPELWNKCYFDKSQSRPKK